MRVIHGSRKSPLTSKEQGIIPVFDLRELSDLLADSYQEESVSDAISQRDGPRLISRVRDYVDGILIRERKESPTGLYPSKHSLYIAANLLVGRNSSGDNQLPIQAKKLFREACVKPGY